MSAFIIIAPPHSVTKLIHGPSIKAIGNLGLTQHFSTKGCDRSYRTGRGLTYIGALSGAMVSLWLPHLDDQTSRGA